MSIGLSNRAKNAIAKLMAQIGDEYPGKAFVPSMAWVVNDPHRPDPYLEFGVYERHQIEDLIEVIDGLEIVLVMTPEERAPIEGKTIDWSGMHFFIAEDRAAAEKE